ncbi:pep-cterm sorting domain-containing protein [Anaeramoeba ignava]|uniref:Pep-cterm sorting domain-containing protein n=1 Tax=Anaeramoeba ignava TaxID=1746090 RepID=A0A9Q0LYI9_ANAIG|nr:pep-cterm sorting domain-containing protein [Anaeramoeba ignava]
MTKIFSSYLKLSNDLRNLLQNTNSHSDFEIVITRKSESPKIYRCHRAILSCRSDYFNGVFRSNMKESQEGRIELSDISEQFMENILTYMYTGQYEISLENAIESLIISKKFCFEELAEFSTTFIKDNIDTESVADVLNISIQFGCQDLYDFCMKFVIQNFHDVSKSSTFANIAEHELSEIIASDDLTSLSEQEILQAVIAWARKQLNMETTTLPHLQVFQSIREKFELLLNKIRFCEFSKHEIQEFVQAGLVSEEIHSLLLDFFTIRDVDEDHVKLENFKSQLPDSQSLIFEERIRFPRSLIVKNSNLYMGKLREWIADLSFYRHMRVGFRASVDGRDATTFHSKCDNKGKTLVIIETTEGSIFGGLTSIGWRSGHAHNYVRDENAFIFTLQNPSGSPPQKFDVQKNNPSAGIRDFSDTGPIFGGSNWDISVNSTLTSGWTNFGGGYQLPSNLETDSISAKEFLAGSFNQWTIKELEVFFVDKRFK